MDRARYSSRMFAAPKTAFARNRGWLTNRTSILLCVLFTVMFARVITALGVPSIINFAHLGLVPCLAFFVLISRPSRAATKILRGVLALLATIVLSAFVNEAGPVNAILEFLVLGEPFFFFIAILSRPWLLADIKRFRLWLLLIALFHLGLTLVQWLTDWTPDVVFGGADGVQGLFLGQGAGHHVGGALALTAAVYFSSDSPMKSFLGRVATTLALAMVAIISDSKTVIAAFMAAIPVIVLFKLKNFGILFKYTIQVTAVLLVCLLALSFTSLQLARVSQIDVGILHKWSTFTIITDYHVSSINAVIGLGPGHTGSRVAMMIPVHYDLLSPLGVTTSPVTQRIEEANWAPNSLSHPWTGSSAWALNYTWASLWGDLGYLGLMTYLLLWLRVWRIACAEDHTRVMWIAAMILGSMFTYLEEPGYTVYLISLLGLSVQQRHSRRWFQLLDATRNPVQINPTAKLRYR